MGKILGSGISDVRVKVPRNTGGAVCSAELVRYLTCLDASGGDDTKCAAAREALGKCMAAPGLGKKASGNHKAPINFHLRRFLASVKR